MKLKKLVALLAALTVLMTAFAGLSLTTASAATVTTDYTPSIAETGTYIGIDYDNFFRHENMVVRYDYGFDAQTDFPANASIHSTQWYKFDWYTGANYTATNEHGVEIAVNEYGFITAIEDGVGNMAIPTNGYVLSANGTKATEFRGYIQSGELAVGNFMRTSNMIGFSAHRTNEDSQYTHASSPFAIKKSQIMKITEGGAGVTTGSNEWNCDVLVRAPQTGADGIANHAGYVVKYGGNNIEVPAGYFALTLAGQSIHDTAKPSYNLSYFFKHFAAPGAKVNIGANEVFVIYNAEAAVRGAYLLTGLTNESLPIPVDTVYDFSASAILNDAKTNYELVDTATIQSLYDNMVEVTNILNTSGFTTKSEVEPYHATINQNYAQICNLEYEQRSVEMRAVWIRPLPNDRKERTVAELDALLRDEIVKHKNLGYNQIFVEAFYNSCTIFPVPETAGHKGLYYSQNPYLVPTNMTCGSSGKPGLNSKLTESYDMLQRFIDICREEGVEPHIWWEVFYVGYTRTDPTVTDSLFEYSVAQQILNSLNAGETTYANWINQAHTGSYYYGAETDGAHQYFLSPASDNVRTFLLNTFEHIFKTYDAESLQLDYIRYPHTSAEKCFGYDAGTMWKFQQSEYYDAAVHTDAYLKTYTGFYDEDWVQFRADCVTTFVKQVRAKIAEVNPGYYLTSSPGADPADSKKNLMQDVEYWLTNDLIDVLYPMAYGENVPGMVAPGLVANNKKHFVCIGTSAGYDDDGFEARWLKEVRDAGADGIAAFGTIDSWVNYAWQNPAITPTGNAAKAARQYLADTVTARAAKMVELNGITKAKKDAILTAVSAADNAIRLYGIESEQALTAINGIQTVADTLGTNPKAALTKDVEYILKIRNNSHDVEKEDFALGSNTDGTAATKETLKIDGASVASDADSAFVYSASTNTLLINNDWLPLSGELKKPVTLVAGSNVEIIELNNVTLTAENEALIESDGVIAVELTGKNNVIGNIGDVSYFGTGALYNGDTLVRMQGDVTGNEQLDTSDVRYMLMSNVKIELNEAYTAKILTHCDANGDGKINTKDTRMFLVEALQAAK